MPSETYLLFREAILGDKQVTCVYRGHYRELCPVIIGTREEKVLAFQFGGASSTKLPPGVGWGCLYLARVKDAALRDGREGGTHKAQQTCLEDVDLDINVHVRKRR